VAPARAAIGPERRLTLRSGTLVDATIIDPPSSTKNEARARAPEMSSTKKGNTWYFGSEEDQKRRQWRVFSTNAHVGVDADSGIVHSLETTTGSVHDSQVWDALLHGAERSVWADKGYVSAAREAAFEPPRVCRRRFRLVSTPRCRRSPARRSRPLRLLPVGRSQSARAGGDG
jgi:IS5 family transposase